MKSLPGFTAGCLLAVTSFAASAARCPSSADTYKAFATAAQPNSAAAPSYYIRAGLAPIVVDPDEMLMIVVPRGVSDIVLGASIGGAYLASFVSTLPAGQAPARPAWSSPDLGFTSSVIATQGTSGCKSLLFQKAGASFLVAFNSDGSIKGAQSLVPSAAGGADLTLFASTATDVTGDGRQDLVLMQNNHARAVLVAQADGTLLADGPASVQAVWNSFLAACVANDRTGAVDHLWTGSSNAHAASLLDSSSNITKLGTGIVATEITSSGTNLYAINLIYHHTSPDEYVSYQVRIMNSGGAWYIQSL